MDQKNRLEALKRGHKKRKGARKVSEEYLEAIYELARQQKKARPIDISRTLNVAPSTVRKVLNRLVQQGYVAYEPYRELTLTEQGEEQVYKLKKRHDTLAKLLTILGMEPMDAEVEAERIEHNLTEYSTEFFQALLEALEENPEALAMLRSKISERLARVVKPM
ncbi:MAG: metal-dependent transcriptional regulator [Aigarchaeota archaeon]|nr:metal-dependent transcriptional regulator [Candidatus Pelearchaeum maunauluense]